VEEAITSRQHKQKWSNAGVEECESRREGQKSENVIWGWDEAERTIGS
jgi:hypothetical protein